MNKFELVKALAKDAGVNQETAANFVASLEKIVKETVVEKGEQIQITGFGTFKQKVGKSRDAINPLNKKKIKTKAYRSLSFTASQSVKKFD